MVEKRMRLMAGIVLGMIAGWVAGCGPSLPSQAFGLREDPSLGETASSDVIVQLFNWSFAQITDEIPRLAELGYGQIHVSPPNLTIASDQWWGRYQPVDYRLVAGPLGDEAAFKTMIEAAHAHGLKILVDVVFNHTANELSPLPAEAEELRKTKGALFGPEDYHPAFCITDYNDVYQVRKGRLCGGPGDRGLPDLRQDSHRVLSVQQEFLKKLIGMGVDGFRFDAVKHMEPDYFPKLLQPEILAGRYHFGEIIADATTYERDMAPYLATSDMDFYDFPLRDTIQRAFSFGGRLATLFDPSNVPARRQLSADRAVTFVMNHDIPNNDGFRGMILDPVDESLAYAYLMGRGQGIPYVYSDLGAKAGGGLRDERWAYAHRDTQLVQMIRFHNATRGQGLTVLLADACRLIWKRDDEGLVGINKCADRSRVFVEAGFAKGSEYKDLLQGQRVVIEGAFIEVELPPRSAVMYLRSEL